MKVSKEIYNMSMDILNQFDPCKLKQKELSKLQLQQQKLEQKTQKEIKNWDNIVKNEEINEQIEEVKEKNFENAQKEMIHKMMGCSKDHAAEIDIYNKTYKEKIQRIQLMKQQGNEAIQDFNKNQESDFLQKASYYYQQALLIFYYLIPENDEEEKESNMLKLQCHLNLSLCYFKMIPQKGDECLQELHDALKIDKYNSKALFRQAKVYQAKGKWEESLKSIEKFLVEFKSDSKSQEDVKMFESLKIEVDKQIVQSEINSKELAQKMVSAYTQDFKQNDDLKIKINENDGKKEIFNQDFDQQNAINQEPQIENTLEFQIKNTQEDETNDKNNLIDKLNEDIEQLKKRVQQLESSIQFIQDFGFLPNKKVQKNEIQKQSSQIIKQQLNPIDKLQIILVSIFGSLITYYAIIVVFKF